MNSATKTVCWLIAIALPLLSLTGCVEEKTVKDAKPAGDTAAIPETIFVKEKPAGARPLIEVKGNAKKGDTISFVARIGGRADPFVKERAVMLVIDPSLPSCGEMKMEDGCKTPWDYCCESAESLTKNTATVQIVGADGRPIKTSLENSHGLKALKTVIISGTVTEAGNGALTVNATSIYQEG